MPTEFNNALHKTFFMEGDTLRNGNAYSIRVSEIILAGLRSAGILDNMIDGNSPPGDITKLWLDKNTDPAILKIWETAGSVWRAVTFSDFFGLFNPLQSVKLNTTADGVASIYTLTTAAPSAPNGHIYIDVYAGGVLQPKDGVSYTVINSGTQIQFSEVPPDDMTIYVEGVANFYEAVSAADASLIPNDSDAPGDYVDDALTYLHNNGSTFSAWTSGVTKTMKERSKRICHIADFDVDRTGSNASTDGLEDWLAEAQNGGVMGVIGSDGSGAYNYIIERELEITKPGQVIHFDQTGGYSYSENFGDDWQYNGRLTATGSWFGSTGKRVRTRRLFRGSSGDPQDGTMSAVINIQAQGVRIDHPHIFLYKDYTSTDPTNYGSAVDVGIFNGCRVGVEINHPTIVGHFRKAGIYFDVTHRYGLSRHLSIAGAPYQDGNEGSVSDGCRVIEPYIRGSRKAIAILGSRPKTGETAFTDPYYDEQLGATVADGRGGAGFSDFYCTGGKMWSVDHETDRRAADPTLSGGALNETSLMAEPDNMPAIVHIDGLTNNASGALWNMSFHRTRFATFEAFHARLDFAARVTFDNCHFENRNTYDGLGAGRKDTAGTVIDTNDYNLNTYGDVTGTANTSRVKVLGTPRANKGDGIGPHYYGASLHFETASGIVAAPVFAGVEDLEMRSSASGVINFRNDSSTAMNIPNGGVYAFTSASSANVGVTGGNVLFRSTSSGDFKTDVEPMDEGWRTRLPKWEPKFYRSTAERDRKDWSWYGLIAEDVVKIDPRYVSFRTEELVLEEQTFREPDDDGTMHDIKRMVEVTRPLAEPKPDNVFYDRIVCDALLASQDMYPNVQRLLEVVEELKARISTLEGGK